MPSTTAQAAATGLPETDFAAQIFPQTKLASMSMQDLAALSQLLWALQGAITQSFLINAPGPVTPACEMLQDLSAVVICGLSDIATIAQAHRPASVAEARWRGWLLMCSAAQFCTDLADMSVAAARVAADESTAGPCPH